MIPHIEHVIDLRRAQIAGNFLILFKKRLEVLTRFPHLHRIPLHRVGPVSDSGNFKKSLVGLRSAARLDNREETDMPKMPTLTATVTTATATARAGIPGRPRLFRRPGRRLVLALCGVLLGGCVLAYKPPGLYDLPAYDPERGSKSDALLFTDGDLLIRSIDGKERLVGPGYWQDTKDDMYRFYPLGPGPTQKVPEWKILRVSKIKYDSALLSPGMHSVNVSTAEARYDEEEDELTLHYGVDHAEVRFQAWGNRPYKVYRYYIPGNKDKRFWLLVVEGVCPGMGTDYKDWRWALHRECFMDGQVAGSNNPALVGKPMKELFPEF